MNPKTVDQIVREGNIGSNESVYNFIAEITTLQEIMFNQSVSYTSYQLSFES